MSTQTATGGSLMVVVAADTKITSAATEAVTARLPQGSGMTDGDQIVFECTGGSLMVVETFRGRKVGIVPGDGQAVVVYEPGNESEDFWRFLILAASPASTIADEAAATAATATGTLAALAAGEVLVKSTLAIGADLTKFTIGNALVTRHAGRQVEKADEDDIALGTDTINTGTAAGQFWGIWMIEMTAAGVVTAKVPSADQVHASEAAAIAAIPAVTAGSVKLGYITVETVANLAFTAGTHEIDGTTPTSTVNFVDEAVSDLISAALDEQIVDNAALIVDDLAMVTDFNSLRAKVNTIFAVLEDRGFLNAE